MIILYVDSSVLVSAALKDPQRATTLLKAFRSTDQVTISELAVVECQAGVSSLQQDPQDRLHTETNLNQLLARAEFIAISSEVLGVARALVRNYRAALGLRAADAIHIATANLIRQTLHSPRHSLRYLTADKRQHLAFKAEGHSGEWVS